jgi:hypothetical protein
MSELNIEQCDLLTRLQQRVFTTAGLLEVVEQTIETKTLEPQAHNVGFVVRHAIELLEGIASQLDASQFEETAALLQRGEDLSAIVGPPAPIYEEHYRK